MGNLSQKLVLFITYFKFTLTHFFVNYCYLNVTIIFLWTSEIRESAVFIINFETVQIKGCAKPC